MPPRTGTTETVLNEPPPGLPRSLCGRLRIGLLALAVAGAVPVAGAVHEAHPDDEPCAVCQLRTDPVAELRVTAPAAYGTPEPLPETPVSRQIASGRIGGLGARAPPA